MSETANMNVYRKLQLARVLLQNTKLNKSGRNKFAGYDYFELGDFIPAIQAIFEDVGLCGVISYTNEVATLTIHNTEGNDKVEFTSPMSRAELKGCHEVQNLGAVQTYLRRYLWTNALEIVEHDALDLTTGSEEVKPKEVKPKEVKPKEREQIKGAEGGWQMIANAPPEGDPSEWLKVIGHTAETALAMATSKADVMDIFKKNKTLFDAVKKTDPEFFTNLMASFTIAKEKFGG
jgi:ERF superfamily